MEFAQSALFGRRTGLLDPDAGKSGNSSEINCDFKKMFMENKNTSTTSVLKC